MQFGAWSYRYLLGLVPVLLALYIYAFIRKRQAVATFMELALAPQLLPGLSRTRQWLKALCLVGAVGCLVLALMQPQWGKHWQDLPRRGRDLLILLDVSLSMLAEDMKPNRLERAKIDIKELVRDVQKQGGHRLGLIVFAGRARLQCPLTLDYAFFVQRLNEVRPGIVEREGTAIGEALRQALRGFGPLVPKYTDMILITDGEDHESLPLEAAQVAAEQQVSLHTMGVGDAGNGTRIPLQDAEGRRFYAQYQGQEVRSRMQPALLLEMARRTGGTFMLAGTRPIELDRIYTEEIAAKARRDIEVIPHEGFVHRYHWFVLSALLLLAVDMLLRERRVNPEG
jgi:Ca-activated chloride channel family protein